MKLAPKERMKTWEHDKGVTLRHSAYIEKLAREWLPDGVPSSFHFKAAPHAENIQSAVLDALSLFDRAT